MTPLHRLRRPQLFLPPILLILLIALIYSLTSHDLITSATAASPPTTSQSQSSAAVADNLKQTTSMDTNNTTTVSFLPTELLDWWQCWLNGRCGHISFDTELRRLYQPRVEWELMKNYYTMEERLMAMVGVVVVFWMIIQVLTLIVTILTAPCAPRSSSTSETEKDATTEKSASATSSTSSPTSSCNQTATSPCTHQLLAETERLTFETQLTDQLNELRQQHLDELSQLRQQHANQISQMNQEHDDQLKTVLTRLEVSEATVTRAQEELHAAIQVMTNLHDQIALLEERLREYEQMEVERSDKRKKQLEDESGNHISSSTSSPYLRGDKAPDSDSVTGSPFTIQPNPRSRMSSILLDAPPSEDGVTEELKNAWRRHSIQPHLIEIRAKDARIAELEKEIASLKEQLSANAAVVKEKPNNKNKNKHAK